MYPAAALKSLRPIDEDEGEEPPRGAGRNEGVDFHGERRGNETHRSTTDPEARLARKGFGKEARLCYAGHVLSENRHGLIVAAELTQASGTAEREAGLRLLARQRRRRGGRMSVGADKSYDARSFVAGVRALGVTPHVAAKASRGALDGRTTRHASYAVSQRRRKIVEEGFGWMKTIGGLRKLRLALVALDRSPAVAGTRPGVVTELGAADRQGRDDEDVVLPEALPLRVPSSHR